MENDRVSLTYDKLMRLSAGMGIDISMLFGASAEDSVPAATQGRRSVTRHGEGRLIDSPNYLHLYAATELLNKRFIPIIVEPRTHSLEDFGELVRHVGEEFIYVLEGEIDVHTSLYAPVRLKAGDSIYLDSTMAHGYVAAAPGPCRVLAVCSGNENQMIAAVGGVASEDDTPPKTIGMPHKTASPKRKNASRKPR